MAVVSKITDEQFKQLLESIRAPSLDSSKSKSNAKHHFDYCSFFNGETDADEVELFIGTLKTCKKLDGISDEDALKSITLLFQGYAATWWKGVRKEAKCWADVPKMLRLYFSPTKPPYQIYMEIFANKQDDETPIHIFVWKQRALLAQLPNKRHDEATEIDFIYGLLNAKYRKYIDRHDIKSFRDLLAKGRVIEQNHRKDSANQQRQYEETTFRRKRCSICKYRGHTYRQCRRNNKSNNDQNEQQNQAKHSSSDTNEEQQQQD